MRSSLQRSNLQHVVRSPHVPTLTLAPLLKQELMESQPRSARAKRVVMVRVAAVAAVEICNMLMQGTALAAWDEGVEKTKRALERT
jgi:hypothetical protein